MKKSYLIVFTSLFFITSCSKNKTENSCPLTESNLLGSYLPVSIKYKATASSAEQEILTNPAYYTSCKRDDLNILKTGNIFTYSDEGEKCIPDGTGNATWSISGNTVTIGSQISTITQFDCDGMTVSIPNYYVAGDHATIVFEKQ